MLRDPLMADGSQIGRVRAPAPGCDEDEEYSQDGESQGDPHGIHDGAPRLM